LNIKIRKPAKILYSENFEIFGKKSEIQKTGKNQKILKFSEKINQRIQVETRNLPKKQHPLSQSTFKLIKNICLFLIIF
jgi:hypothetical protein